MSKFIKKNDPIVIVNKDFKRCILFVSYPIKKISDAHIAILEKIAFDRSFNYDTDKKIFEATVNNYCISYRSKITSIGDNSFLELILSFPSYDSLGKNVLLDNLKFVYDLIYNPYLENGVFPNKNIQDIKDIKKNRINKNFKDGLWCFKYRNDMIIDEDDFLKDELCENPGLLDEVTPFDIYNLYKDIISKSPIVFLIGNVDEEYTKEMISEILLNNKVEDIVFEKKYSHYCKNIVDEPEVTCEKVNFKSTGIAYNYKVRDLVDERDIAILKIIKMLLNSSCSRVLYDNLRKHNDFVYRCGAYIYPSFGSLTIWAITGNNNIDSVSGIFNKIMKEISDLDFINDKFDLIKDDALLDDKLLKEELYNILMLEVDKYIGCKEHTFYEIIKDIKSEEIKEFIDNRLVLVSKYIGVGEDNE